MTDAPQLGDPPYLPATNVNAPGARVCSTANDYLPADLDQVRPLMNVILQAATNLRSFVIHPAEHVSRAR